MASGNCKFFLGTDSCAHPQERKETARGCAGCYSAPAAIELYAEIFEQLGILDKLEAFASFHGATFYGLPRNSGKIVLRKESWNVPERLSLAGGRTLVPYWAGQPLNWRLVEANPWLAKAQLTHAANRPHFFYSGWYRMK